MRIERQVQRSATLSRCLLVVLVLAVSACTVRIVSPYDEVLDRGLTEYSQSLAGFFNRMGSATGPAATYSANRPFYDESHAKLTTLRLRAEADDPSQACVVSDAVRRLVGDRLGAQAPAQAPSQAAPDSAEEGGGCMARLIRLMSADLTDLARIHQLENRLTGPAAARARTSMERTIRAALTVQLAKKREQRQAS